MLGLVVCILRFLRWLTQFRMQSFDINKRRMSALAVCSFRILVASDNALDIDKVSPVKKNEPHSYVTSFRYETEN
ncbi:MAG: hypothetical protein ACI9ND_002268 [Yoonia sp.]|jgi:hypothetical protein